MAGERFRRRLRAHDPARTATTGDARPLHVAAEQHERRHGYEGSGEEDEDAGLDALECPVAAGGLVGEVPAEAVVAHAGKHPAYPLTECRPAGARDDGHVVDG